MLTYTHNSFWKYKIRSNISSYLNKSIVSKVWRVRKVNEFTILSDFSFSRIWTVFCWSLHDLKNCFWFYFNKAPTMKFRVRDLGIPVRKTPSSVPNLVSICCRICSKHYFPSLLLDFEKVHFKTQHYLLPHANVCDKWQFLDNLPPYK